jgi:hypothetical protein
LDAYYEIKRRRERERAEEAKRARERLEKQFMTWYQDEKKYLDDTKWADKLPPCPCALTAPKKVIQKPTRPPTAVEVAEPPNVQGFGSPGEGWEMPTTINLWAQRNLPGCIVKNYHPGAYFDLRSKPDKDGHRQQCTYDINGKLITHGPGAGTADKSADNHFKEDVDPFVWALELDGGQPGKFVDLYLEVRPIDKQNKCPKNP